jgi:hypothetical protein
MLYGGNIRLLYSMLTPAQVLLEHNLDTLVARGREIKRTGSGKRIGAALTKPLARFSPQAIITYLLSIPLNLIPLVGTVFFILYNGVRGGPGWHARYFVLKRFGKDEKARFIRERRGAYSRCAYIWLRARLQL